MAMVKESEPMVIMECDQQIFDDLMNYLNFPSIHHLNYQAKSLKFTISSIKKRFSFIRLKKQNLLTL